MIIRARRERNFSVISNEVLENATLSYAAKGLLVCLLSRPDNWTVSYRQLAAVGPDGAHTTRRLLRELEAAGYLVRTRTSSGYKKFTWVSMVFDCPQQVATRNRPGHCTGRLTGDAGEAHATCSDLANAEDSCGEDSCAEDSCAEKSCAEDSRVTSSCMKESGVKGRRETNTVRTRTERTKTEVTRTDPTTTATTNTSSPDGEACISLHPAKEKSSSSRFGDLVPRDDSLVSLKLVEIIQAAREQRKRLAPPPSVPEQPPHAPPVLEQPQTRTAQQTFFDAVCWVVGWDPETLTKEQSGQVAQTLGVLSKADYQVEEVRRFWREVWQKDWRWVRNKARPTLSQLGADIGKLRMDERGSDHVRWS